MDVDAVAKLIPQLPPGEREAALEALEQYVRLVEVERAQRSFLGFVRHMWPEFIESGHHRVMAEAFDRVLSGECNRLMINMPPRFTKSEFASNLFPAYSLGKHPEWKIMQTSNTTELAVGFGRKVRNLVASPEFQDVFKDVSLSQDSKAAGRWNTNHRGEYFAAGVGSALAGRGADLLIIDDPHSEQEAYLNSLAIYENAYEWYKTGPRQRLQPGGRIVVVATRWHKMDLCGRIMKAMSQRDGGDVWEIIELPAIVDEYGPNERSLWPSFWPLEELQKTRDVMDHGNFWKAQYQQNPTSEEGAIVKRDWWKIWEEDEPPHVNYIIQCWDTAYTAKQTSDFSACSTWGVWSDDNEARIILLDAFKERLEFPELKARAIELWNKYKPDSCLIEAKASGWPLIHELRKMGIPVSDITYSRGEDKNMRVHSVADIFKSGLVWAPDRLFAKQMIEEFAEFPYGDADDLLDTGTMALRRFREGGFLRLPSDEVWDEGPKLPLVADYY